MITSNNICVVNFGLLCFPWLDFQAIFLISLYSTLQIHQKIWHIWVLVTSIDNYALGTKYCRQKIWKGGVSILFHNNLQFMNIRYDNCCVDKNIEVCTTELDFTFLNICVLVIYSSPTGKFNNFLTQLDMIMQTLYTPKLNVVIWGDIYINYLKDNDKKNQLDAFLKFLQSYQHDWFSYQNLRWFQFSYW